MLVETCLGTKVVGVKGPEVQGIDRREVSCGGLQVPLALGRLHVLLAILVDSVLNHKHMLTAVVSEVGLLDWNVRLQLTQSHQV